MSHGHVTGLKKERKPRTSTLVRDAQKAEAIAQRAAELAAQMMQSWQVAK